MEKRFLDYDARRSPKTDRYCAKCQRDIESGVRARLVFLDVSSMMVTHPRAAAGYEPLFLIGEKCAREIGFEWTVDEDPAWELVRLAHKLAAAAHDGDFRTDGLTPAITHPVEVMRRVHSPIEKAVAALHDTLEDTSLTSEAMLDAGIPVEVVLAVETLTKRKGQRYEDYLAGVRRNPLSRVVKVQDMLANLKGEPSDHAIRKYIRGLRYLNGS